MQSDYLKKLVCERPEVAERYQLKIKLIDDLDPFTLELQDLDISIDDIPPVTSMDVIAYLVLTHSYYTKDQMKAFRSLTAYKYFESGTILIAGTRMVNNVFILIGKEKHSQRINLKLVELWCIISKDGSISTAHCTCMASNNEVCDHVAALLFAVEYINKRKESISCIDKPSMSASVPIVPVKEMNWGKSLTREKKEIPPMTMLEIKNMLSKFEGGECCLLRIVEPFATEIALKVKDELP